MTKNRGLAKTPHMAAQKHFWAMIREGDRSAGCWLWPFATNGAPGYGYVNGAVVGKDGPVLVHRAAYLVTHPDDLAPPVVRHRCDVRACFNPDHLEPGTPLDNSRDMDLRGRRPQGETHPSSKLTATQVLEMRALAKDGATLQTIASRFHVSKSHASRVLHGHQWRHLEGSAPTEGAA